MQMPTYVFLTGVTGVSGVRPINIGVWATPLEKWRLGPVG
jgi:hypothetical protein